MVFTRHQLRAARALLALNQEALAVIAEVGITTIRKYENGHEVEPGTVRKLLEAVEAEGAVIVPEGTLIDGEASGAGVALRPAATLPRHTRARLAEVDTVGGVPTSVGRGRGKRLRTSDDRRPVRGGTRKPGAVDPGPPTADGDE